MIDAPRIAEDGLDRDRLLYSSALKRLAGITQVISPIEGDIVHNRLTQYVNPREPVPIQFEDGVMGVKKVRINLHN